MDIAGIWHNEGIAHYKLGEYSEAIKCYKKTRKLYLLIKPRGRKILVYIIKVLFNQGYLHFKLNERSKAVDCWKQVIDYIKEYIKIISDIKFLEIGEVENILEDLDRLVYRLWDYNETDLITEIDKLVSALLGELKKHKSDIKGIDLSLL